MNTPGFAARTRGADLSPQQRAAWDQGRAGRPAMAYAWLRCEGPHTVAALRAALAEVVAEHEILRTHFEHDPRFKYPLALLAAERAPPGRELDLRGLPAEAQLERLRLAAAPDGTAPLDVVIARSADSAHLLLLSMPALCADAATVPLLLEAWNRALRGQAPAAHAEEPPLRYEEFAIWQNELANEAGAASSAPEPLPLPFAATAREQPQYVHREYALPAALGAQLRELARRHQVSMAALCQALFCAQLARLYDRRAFPLVIESSGRAFADVRSLFGPVARVRLVADCAAGLEFDRALVQAAEQALAHADEDDCPLPDVAFRSLTQHVGFAFRDLAVTTAGPLQLERLELDPVGPRHLLAVHAQGGDALRVTLAFDSACMSASGADVLLTQYVSALGELAAQPALPCRLAFAADGPVRVERGRACDAAPCDLLHRHFERAAAQHPARLALVSGSDSLSYGELDRRANQLAHRLHKLGVRSEEPVGLWAERKASAIVALLAILKAGAAYVPLDPEAPPERLRQQARTAGLCFLVVASGGSLLELQTIAADDPTLGDEPGSRLAGTPARDQLASLIFTSGSTGVPKAVAITQRAIASYAEAILALLALPEPAHFAVVSTLSADLGNTSVFGALASGGTLHLMDYATATDGRAFADYCARWPLDVLKIVPSHLTALLDAGQGRAILPRRALVLGGEAFSPALRARIEALAPSCALFNHYGPTETTVGACALPVAELRDTRGAATIPVGFPLANAEAYVLDEQLTRTPIGAVGELYLGGAGLARGYHDRADLTAERFVPHPFVRGARLYRTGDRARYRPDGSIEFMGRRDHQLKIRGFRVELGEIEARLREHPALSAAVVLARPSAAGQALAAYVVPHAQLPDEQELRQYLRARLPDYMIPQELVALAALPLTPNGKVDRTALEKAGAEVQRPFRAPVTEQERVLAALWAELLGVPRVGLDDDFFALGGHSLLAIPLLHRIRQAFDVSLSLGAIFELPTVAGLAQRLAESPPSGLTVLKAGVAQPALFCFDPTGFHAPAYLALARSMEQRACYALELADLLEEPCVLEVTGQRLAQRIRRQQPRGPYHLLGWSLGGVLALASARALEVAGEQVAYLGIIDTHPRSELYAQGEPDAFEELTAYLTTEQAAALAQLPASARAELRHSVQAATGPARVAAAVRWAQRAGALPDDMPAELFHARYVLLRAGAEFMRALPPAALACPIQVCWSQDTRVRLGDAATRWQRYTRGHVSEHVVPGDHEAALQSPETHAHVARALSGR